MLACIADLAVGLKAMGMISAVFRPQDQDAAAKPDSDKWISLDLYDVREEGYKEVRPVYAGCWSTSLRYLQSVLKSNPFLILA